MEHAVGIVGRHPCPSWGNALDVVEAEVLTQCIAIGDRLGNMLSGFEENHRDIRVYTGDHVQENGGIRLERGHLLMEP